MILALQNVACSCSHQLKDKKGLSHKQIGINMFCSSCSLDKDVEKQKKCPTKLLPPELLFFFFLTYFVSHHSCSYYLFVLL